MIWFILYLLSVGVAAVGFLGFNKHYKWVTKEKLKDNIDEELIWAAVILGILFWPIGLTIVGFVKLSTLIKESLIPE